MLINPFIFGVSAPPPIPFSGSPERQQSTWNWGGIAASPRSAPYPSEVAEDEVAILILSTSASPAVTHTTPAGWNVLSDTVHSTNHRTTVWWKRLTGLESGNVTLTMSGSVLNYFHSMHTYEGALESGTPVEIETSYTKSNNSTQHFGIPIQQYANRDCTVVNFHFTEESGLTMTPGSGFSTITDAVSSGTRTSMTTERSYGQPCWMGEEVVTNGTDTSADFYSISIVILPENPTSDGAFLLTDPYIAETEFLCSFDDKNSAHPWEAANGAFPTAVGAGTHDISTAQKKFGVSSLNVNGGNMSFPDSSRWHFGSGNFTIEGWVRFAAVGAGTDRYLIAQYDTNAQRAWALVVNSANQIACAVSADGAAVTSKATGAWTPTVNTWYHVAADFDGTNYRTYVDGVVMGTTGTPVTVFDSSAALTIGGRLATGAHSSGPNGFIDEVRITKGIARYAGAFTPPAAAFPRE